MTAGSETAEQLKTEVRQLRQRVAELETWKSRHEGAVVASSQSEAQIRNFAENFVAGVCIIKDSYFKYANAKAAEIFGYAVDELVDNVPTEALVLPEDWPGVRENISLRTSRQKKLVGYEFRGIKKDGEIVEVEVYGSSMDFEGGSALLCTILDITRRVRSEADLEKEANKFRALYDLAVAMTADNDLDENLSIVVEQSRKLLGFDASYIALRDDTAGELYMHTLSGITIEAFKRVRLPVGSGVGGKVAATQKGLVVRDYFKEVESPFHDIVRAEGLISGIAVPIQMGRKNLGVLYGFNRTKTSFSESDLDTLFLLGNLAAIEITRGRQSIDLRKARDDLEQKVHDRTAKLSAANEHLRQEIIERKKAEDGLRESEAMLRSVLSTSPVAIGLGENRIMKWANEAWLEMFGLENQDDVVGLRADKIYPSEAEYERVGQILYESLQTGRVTSIDATLRRKDGFLFDAHIRMKALSLSDLSTGTIAAITDISERKRIERALTESEQRYRALAENSLTGICVHQQGRHVYVNERYAKDLGYSADELIGKSVEQVVAPQDCEMVKEMRLGRLAGKEIPSQYQFRALRKDGSVKWREVRASVIEHNGNPAILANVIDITKQKQAEDSLKALLDFRRTLIDSIPSPVFYKDINHKYLGCNEAFASLLGLPKDEVVGKTVYDVVPKEVADVWRKKDLQLFDHQQVQIYEFSVPQADGSERAFVNHKAPFFDPDGTLAGLIGVMVDITDRLLAEEAVRQSEQRYRTLVENSFSGLMLLKGFQIIFANSRLCEMLGYSLTELEGVDVFDIYDPDYHQIVRERAAARMRSEEVVSQYEVKLRRKDGSSFDGEIIAKAVKVESKQGVQVWVRDVSQRKRSEKVQRRLATAVEQAAEAIVVTDTSGNIQYMNPAFERITGYTRKEVIGRNPRFLKSGKHDEVFYKDLWETVSRGEVWTGRLINRKKDGSLYHEESTISPVRDSGGKIINFVAVKRDITEHFQLSQQLLHAQKMEAVGTLAGGIAHDFNNLLQVILGFSEWLLTQKREVDAEYADLQKIFHAARNGAELVQRLLTFSRKVEPQPISLNLNRQIVQVEKLLRRTIPKMIDIEMNLADDLAEVNADPTQIEQVLMNLAVNARDAMPDRGRLTIATGNTTLDEEYCKVHVGADPGEYVVLTVSDTGHGIDKDIMEHVFEPFYTTKELGRGTGLGLAMVYGIVRQHGGHITCESQAQAGTTFSIYLPALRPDRNPL